MTAVMGDWITDDTSVIPTEWTNVWVEPTLFVRFTPQTLPSQTDGHITVDITRIPVGRIREWVARLADTERSDAIGGRRLAV